MDQQIGVVDKTIDFALKFFKRSFHDLYNFLTTLTFDSSTV